MSRSHLNRISPRTRAAGALLCACALLVALAPPAVAHAVLLSTDPAIDQVVGAPPERVVLSFNEPVEIAFGAVRVFDTDAERVDEGEATHAAGLDEVQVPLQEDLPTGTYTVTWRVISADSHPAEGAFVFHVGAPGSRPEGIAETLLAGEAGAGKFTGLFYGVARWGNFAALLLLVGAAIFAVGVWRRTSPSMTERPVEVEERFARRWRRVMVVTWAAAVAVTAAALVLQGAVAGGVPLGEALSGEVISGVLATRFGRVTVLKLGLLIAAAGLWVVAKKRGESLVARSSGASVGAAAMSRPIPAWVLAASGVLALGLLASPGLAGHAGTTSPIPLNLFADSLHMVAAAAWTGGLVVLLAVAFPATRGLGDRQRVSMMAPVVGRFSNLALISVGVLAATGTYRAWVEVQAWRGLTGTDYGLVLLTKLAVFLPLVALGFVNNRWTTPRLKRAAEGAQPGGALSTLRRIVGIEIALVTVVLAVTALLVNLPPARVDAGVTGPFITDVALGENNLNVIVDPNEVGENLIHLTVSTPQGAPAEIQAMKVRFRMPEQDIGPLVGKGKEVGPGHFIVQGRQLSVPGEWVLSIEARIDKFTNATTDVKVTVNE